MLPVVLAMLGVPGMQLDGDQSLDTLAKKLIAAVAEHVLGDAVLEDDPAIGIHLHDGVGRGF
jgi:hypothetical protein